MEGQKRYIHARKNDIEGATAACDYCGLRRIYAGLMLKQNSGKQFPW